jgi:methyltransferase
MLNKKTDRSEIFDKTEKSDKKHKKEQKVDLDLLDEIEIPDSDEEEERIRKEKKKLKKEKKQKQLEDVYKNDHSQEDQEEEIQFVKEIEITHDEEKLRKKKKEKKQKQSEESDQDQININEQDEDEIQFVKEKEITNSDDDEEKPLHKEKKKKNKDKKQNDQPTRHYSLSIVIPSSIVDNAQSKELRTYLVGQIARTAGIFRVDEIIIYHDVLNKKIDKDYVNFFVTNLQYLETPQYLRKTLFPRSDDLVFSGLMNPLDSSHHLRIDEWCPYREGCVLNRPVKKGEGSWVNIGLTKDCKIDTQLEDKTRVTVRLKEKKFENRIKFYSGEACSMEEPKENGLYWGYAVRIAENFKEIFENSFYPEGYDFIIGTSDKGEDYTQANYEKHKDFKHCLLFFGGLQGIEGMLESDEQFKQDEKSIFDLYLNTCLKQGLRTIRTEEAILISLAVLKPKLDEVKN